VTTAVPADVGPPEPVRLPASSVFRIWVRHLRSLIFPSSALLFIWTGPHPWYIAPLFLIPSVLTLIADRRPGAVELRQPVESMPAWPFDLLVYVLTAMQFVVVFSLAYLFTQQSIFSLDMLMVLIGVGASSGFSIITAHELIHRKSKLDQLLGRAILCSVLYEHFYTEHLRGHHVKVGTPEDPATARFGESYGEFWRRTVPAQFKSAWRLEKRRLGDESMSLFDRRMLSNRILHGLVVEWGVALGIGLYWGLAPFIAYLVQAFMAVRLLEAVNYFEHWGLTRKKARVRPVDSWDTHSLFTYYGLVGLSRHADHHAWPSRPYQQLRVWDEAPLLPTGYVGLVDLVMANNDEFRAAATTELERRNLGPFADVEDEAERARLVELGKGEATKDTHGPIVALAGLWQRLPEKLRPFLFWGSLLVAVTVGAQLEAPAEMAFGFRFALHAWILAVFAGVLLLRPKVLGLVRNEWASWALMLTAMVLVGGLTDYVLGL
jgi:alkane 1-monooxygenase